MRLAVSLLAALLLAPFAASAQVIHACVKNGGTIKVVADPVECGRKAGSARCGRPPGSLPRTGASRRYSALGERRTA